MWILIGKKRFRIGEGELQKKWLSRERGILYRWLCCVRMEGVIVKSICSRLLSNVAIWSVRISTGSMLEP